MFLVTAIKRFLGKASDPKPTVGKQFQDVNTGNPPATTTSIDLPVGSTYMEEETGDIWRWNGNAWVLPPKDTAAYENLTKAIRELRMEMVRLRMGMIEAGACQAVPNEDVEEEFIDTTY